MIDQLASRRLLNTSNRSTTYTHIAGMMNDGEREFLLYILCTRAIINYRMCTRAHTHTFSKMHMSFCVYAASCIVVVSKIKRLVVCTRADAREIYSNVDA
jgi:hypothetical protein